MASDLELVHLAFNRVKELSLIYGDSIPHLISIFNEFAPQVNIIPFVTTDRYIDIIEGNINIAF